MSCSSRRRILRATPRSGGVSLGAALGGRVSVAVPVVVLEVAKRAEPRLSRHANQRRRRIPLDHVLRNTKPRSYQVVLEGDADDPVEESTEVELAHMGDRGDLGKREPSVAVHTHVGQRSANTRVRRRYPVRRIRVRWTRPFRDLEAHDHASPVSPARVVGYITARAIRGYGPSVRCASLTTHS